MTLTDQFTERKIQRNLACFLAPEAEFSPEQFAEMKKPFYGIMDAAKLRMNGKTGILFFTEETPLLLQLFQTIDEDSAVEALGGLYYHLSVIAGSELLDSRNLMVDPEYIYYDIVSRRVFFVYLPIRTEGESPKTGVFPEIGEKIAAQIDMRFGADMPPALRTLREALGEEALSAAEIFEKIRAVHPIAAAEEGERLRAEMEKNAAGPESGGRRKGTRKESGTDGDEIRKNPGEDSGRGRKTPESDGGGSRGGSGNVRRKGGFKTSMGRKTGPAAVDMDGTVFETKSDDAGASKILQLMLTSPETGQQIVIEKNTLVIGRKTPDPMGVLRGVPNTVGRQHAEISGTGDGFFIRDLNSRNGTLLNGRTLTPMEMYPLSDGDKVSLAKFVLDVRVNEI